MHNDNAPVIVRHEGAIAYLILNRPASLNSIDIPTAQAFLHACKELTSTAGVRAVIFKGEGKTFGVGGDLSSLRTESATNAMLLLEPMHQAVRLLAGMDAPVIASLQGSIAGGSLSLAMGCDLAIAADTARFNLAYVNIGVNCDGGGSWSLPRLVGLRNAMGIALLGDTFDAQDALRMGLVNRVAPAAELDQATDAIALRLANGPTLAIGRMKRLLRQSFENDLATQLDLEREYFRASADSADFAEALDAFFSKRKPQFAGK
jgi:2-(1,2-epoxy-1,2-dihydrophenyl)acetyl-CoA isomerase